MLIWSSKSQFFTKVLIPCGQGCSSPSFHIFNHLLEDTCGSPSGCPGGQQPERQQGSAELLWVAAGQELASWEVCSTWPLKGHLAVSLPSPGPGAPLAQRASWCLVLWDRRVAVAMVDLDVALTVKVCLEDIAVAMVPPPGAQLPVPGAVQHMEEFRVLHANHGEEVLVPQVAPEVVLVSKLLHPRGLQQMAVEWRLAHGLQV